MMMRNVITTLGSLLMFLLSSLSCPPVMSSNFGLIGETQDEHFHYYTENEIEFSGNVTKEGSNNWTYYDEEDRSSATGSSSSNIGGIPGIPSPPGGGASGGNGNGVMTNPPTTFQFSSYRSIVGSRSKIGCVTSGGLGRGGANGGCRRNLRGGGGGGGGGNGGSENDENKTQ